MEYKISNDLGLITISEDVLLKVAGYAALECYGIVAMSSKRAKDGFVEWLGEEEFNQRGEGKNHGGGDDIELVFIIGNSTFLLEGFDNIKNYMFVPN